jgi:hypothetical protein
MFDDILKFDILDEPLAKHLTGQHDQSSHGRKGNAQPQDSRAKARERFFALVEDKEAFMEAAGAVLLTRAADVGYENPDFKEGMRLGEVRFMPDSEGVVLTGQELLEQEYEVFKIKNQSAFEYDSEVTEEDFEALDKQFQDAIAQSDPSLFNEEQTGKIAADGFSTVFVYNDKGQKYLLARSAYEKVAHDEDTTNTGLKERTVTVAMIPKGETATGAMDSYGDEKIILSDQALGRATFTIGSGLNGRSFPIRVGEKLPRVASLVTLAKEAGKSKGENIFLDPKFTDKNYIEAQIHGGVSGSDFASVDFLYAPFSARDEETLYNMGIPYTHRQGNNFFPPEDD